jgi:hypothetical protein
LLHPRFPEIELEDGRESADWLIRIRGLGDHDATALFTLLNVPLMLVPRVLTMVMQATRIRASMTAYSTAVGPSSLVTNRWTLVIRLRMELSF